MCLAIPGRIASTYETGVSRIGCVQFGSITREALLDLVPEADVGDYVLVHVGVALTRIDEAEAMRTLDMLREIGEEIES